MVFENFKFTTLRSIHHPQPRCRECFAKFLQFPHQRHRGCLHGLRHRGQVCSQVLRVEKGDDDVRDVAGVVGLSELGVDGLVEERYPVHAVLWLDVAEHLLHDLVQAVLLLAFLEPRFELHVVSIHFQSFRNFLLKTKVDGIDMPDDEPA